MCRSPDACRKDRPCRCGCLRGERLRRGEPAGSDCSDGNRRDVAGRILDFVTQAPVAEVTVAYQLVDQGNVSETKPLLTADTRSRWLVRVRSE